ncbi:MAG: M20/M25/M40 family metallo-hydrolase [Bryobacterales bacterium]|nr:M20/M25/M40 family metallo-hydrolase [Bryobacterales bacterium]
MTNLPPALADRLSEYAHANRDRLASIIADLVRIPSENKPPRGSEDGCQQYVAGFLRRLGFDPVVFRPDEVPGAADHPFFWPGRDYKGRPNVCATRTGLGGGGRSLVLSGHIDTVPAGTQPWTKDPFGGQIEGGRLYGRGAVDMKGGIGIGLFALEAMNELKISTRASLLFETVVDEEFGGCNGTLAARLYGNNADAAIILEPSFLRVCPAQRGGRTVHLTMDSPGGVLTEGMFPKGVSGSLRDFLASVEKFAEERRAAAIVHPLYASCPDPVPVSITKISTGPWGMGEPMTVPEQCQIEMYWQTMPGETDAEINEGFASWLNRLPHKPRVEWPIRPLPGSAMDASHPLVTVLAGAAEAQLGSRPRIAGIEGPCDLWVFHEFGIPAVLWGPKGGNIHAADEYLDLDSAVDASATLLRFICEWCEAAG